MAARFGPLDFDEFHLVTMPERLVVHGPEAAADLNAGRPAQPIAFRIDDGRAYTYTPVPGGIEITPGDDHAVTVVELTGQDWSDFVWELRTCFALLYGERLAFARGGFGHLARWEPALRTVFDGQRVYDLTGARGRPAVVAGDGAPLDLTTSFTLDDADATIGDFLDRAGFIHLRAVFDGAEIAAMRGEVEAAVARSRPDDKRSWWTTVGDREVCNRVNYLSDHAPVFDALGDDPRLRRIGALAGEELRAAADRLDGHAVVIKVPGASTGLADLPWHRDCGMGGHPVKCPLLNVGIQLDPATAAAGQLHMIAGSHLGTSRLPTPAEAEGLPTVAITSEPGDVTAHYGHTLHAAPPPGDPTAHGRRAVYVTYVPPLVFEMVGRGEGYNDVLFTRDAGRVHHVDELGARG